VVKTKVAYPKVFKDWDKPKRYKLAYGGRSSSKSWTIARKLIQKTFSLGLEHDEGYILCCREIQKSIEKSVYKLLENQIGLLGLREYFSFTNKSIKNKVTNIEFVFEGLRHNSDAIRSMEGALLVWVEEGQKLTKKPFEEDLDPTIRREGSEIWITFNKVKEDDFIWQFANESSVQSEMLKVECNWRDNPWFPEIMNKLRLRHKKANQALHDYVWEGKFLKDGELQIWKEDQFNIVTNVYTTIEYIEIIADTAEENEKPGTSSKPDDSVFICVGILPDSSLIILDFIHFKEQFNGLRTNAVAFWKKHQTFNSIKPAASVMAIEDKSSGKQLLHMLQNTEILVEPIKRKVKASEMLKDVQPQETKKWRRSSQASQFTAINDFKINLLEADWNQEFIDRMLSVEMFHCGSETGFSKRGDWDLPDAVADAVYRNQIKNSLTGLNAAFAGM